MRRAAGALSTCQPNAMPTFNFSASTCNQVGYYQPCGAIPAECRIQRSANWCLRLIMDREIIQTAMSVPHSTAGDSVLSVALLCSMLFQHFVHISSTTFADLQQR